MLTRCYALDNEGAAAGSRYGWFMEFMRSVYSEQNRSSLKVASFDSIALSYTSDVYKSRNAYCQLIHLDRHKWM